MALTWLCRLLVGGTFLFSGFVKAIDPWGTIYKLNDYLAALGIGLWDNLVLVGVIILCVFEFLTGRAHYGCADDAFHDTADTLDSIEESGG